MATEQIGNVLRIRHPRTDVPQDGWRYKATVSGAANDLYEANVDFGWFTPTQCFRVQEWFYRAKSTNRDTRQFYTDFPQQGWVDKVPGNLWEVLYWPAIETGSDFSYRTAPEQYTKPLGEWEQGLEWLTPAAVFDPVLWPSIETSRNFSYRPPPERYTRAPEGDAFGTPWSPSLPLVRSWGVPDLRMNPERYTRPLGEWNQDIGWVFQNLPAEFDPSQQDWFVHGDWTHRPPYWTGDQPQFIAPQFSAWGIPSDRMAPEMDTKPKGSDVVANWLVPSVIFDPQLGVAISDQLRQTRQTTKRGWYSSDPAQVSWIIPSAIYDPTLWAPLYGEWSGRSRSRRIVDLADVSWVFTNLPPAGYDPSLYPPIAQLAEGLRGWPFSQLDVRAEWSQGTTWIESQFPAYDPSLDSWLVQSDWPIVRRTPYGIFVYNPEMGWLFTNLPPATTTAQVVSAAAKLLAQRPSRVDHRRLRARIHRRHR